MIRQGVALWVHYRVWDVGSKSWKTGDVANHTLYFVKDGVATLADNAPQEVGGGVYRVLSTVAEVNGLFITLHGKSSTSGCYILPTHMLTDGGTKGVGMTVQYMAWDMVNDEPKTGDVANHTLNVAQANTTAVANNTPTEIDAVEMPGLHSIVLDAVETAGIIDSVYGTSSTPNIEIMPISFAVSLATVLPAVGNVLAGEQYGAGGVEFEGTLAPLTIQEPIEVIDIGKFRASL